MASHALPASSACEDSVDFHMAAEDVVSDRCADYDSTDEICLKEMVEEMLKCISYGQKMTTYVVCHEDKHEEER